MKKYKITNGPTKLDSWKIGNRAYIYANGISIGYWYCEYVIQDRYGRFLSNKYGDKVLKNKSYAGGSLWDVMTALDERLNP